MKGIRLEQSWPAMLLRLEGLLLAVTSMATYFLMHESSLLFIVFILAPDIGMLGYLINSRVGSWTYNLLHLEVWPIILGVIGVTMGYPPVLPLALIWATHIGADRLLGFGLKYPTNFKDTHLQRV